MFPEIVKHYLFPELLTIPETLTLRKLISGNLEYFRKLIIIF